MQRFKIDGLDIEFEVEFTDEELQMNVPICKWAKITDSGKILCFIRVLLEISLIFIFHNSQVYFVKNVKVEVEVVEEADQDLVLGSISPFR